MLLLLVCLVSGNHRTVSRSISSNHIIVRLSQWAIHNSIDINSLIACAIHYISYCIVNLMKSSSTHLLFQLVSFKCSSLLYFNLVFSHSNDLFALIFTSIYKCLKTAPIQIQIVFLKMSNTTNWKLYLKSSGKNKSQN